MHASLAEELFHRRLEGRVRHGLVSIGQQNVGGVDLILLQTFFLAAKRGQKAVQFLLVFTAFRFTSVFPPAPHPLIAEKSELPRQVRQIPLCIQPLEVMIQACLSVSALRICH